MKKIIIAAAAQNSVIGIKGKLPWQSKEDLNHFKTTTMGYPIIMGRKTFDSSGKILEGRKNIVLTRSGSLIISNENLQFVNSLDEAFNSAAMGNPEKTFVIGGGEIFGQTIQMVDEMLISRFNFEAEGDVFFPEIDQGIWEFEIIKKFADFKVFRYTRRKAN